mmetsp:Transcript_107054/g.307992  ORF Transcript_107054/g.307992 Transcript_107054/m.307992 type:complete len:89 (+) Transcript_107054:233-499(+)
MEERSGTALPRTTWAPVALLAPEAAELAYELVAPERAEAWLEPSRLLAPMASPDVGANGRGSEQHRRLAPWESDGASADVSMKVFFTT